MTEREQRRRATRAGYSLVEVTLALLVVAIGLTATFALFPEGLKATREAVNDTEAALFADYVFTTLDLTAGKYTGNYGTGWDMSRTDDFISDMLSTNVAVAVSNFQIRATSGTLANRFYWYPNFYGIGSGDYAAANFAEFWTSAFSYTLNIQVSSYKGYGMGVPTYAVLKVWAGEQTNGTPRIFYREILPIR
jgi:hypothetical protein